MGKSRKAEIVVLNKIMTYRDALRTGLQRGDQQARAVVNAYGLWYDAPDDPGAFGVLSSSLDAFIEAQRQTVLA